MALIAESRSPFDRHRLDRAKKAYTTRRVPLEDIALLIEGGWRPCAGDLVLARVDRLGQHSKLELVNGRRAQLHVGDEIIVCFGNRYAPDQFEARINDGAPPYHLVAAGGLAGRVCAAHQQARRPTAISPLGLLANRAGQRLNLRQYALPPVAPRRAIPTVAVVGTSMNAGKTTVAANLIKGLDRAGYKAGAAKITGTGAGGDRWQIIDVGAHVALDFTDVGYASTYRISPREVEGVYISLVGHLAEMGVDIGILELADGVLQKETLGLLSSALFQSEIDAVVFVASDSVGAVAGVQWLTAQSYPVVAVSGVLTRSPLGMREVESWTDVPVLPTHTLGDPAVGRRLWGPLMAGDGESAADVVRERQGVQAQLADIRTRIAL